MGCKAGIEGQGENTCYRAPLFEKTTILLRVLDGREYNWHVGGGYCKGEGDRSFQTVKSGDYPGGQLREGFPQENKQQVQGLLCAVSVGALSSACSGDVEFLFQI